MRVLSLKPGHCSKFKKPSPSVRYHLFNIIVYAYHAYTDLSYGTCPRVLTVLLWHGEKFCAKKSRIFHINPFVLNVTSVHLLGS